MANQHDGNGSGNGNGYKYEPLLDGKAIRLLNLYPGSIDETIRCSLTVTEIDSGYLQYEAISYAWGSPVRSRSIVCNSQALKITESLFTALQRFRFDHHVRALWADAICIDQENTAERSSQINLMGQIYRNASKVLVWLGHEEDAVV
ncbi:heterokaryon incompatibility protein-domain-containing protein, partial [Phaeosphaeriaceae sp. PMI808]